VDIVIEVLLKVELSSMNGSILLVGVLHLQPQISHLLKQFIVHVQLRLLCGPCLLFFHCWLFFIFGPTGALLNAPSPLGGYKNVQ